MRHSILTTVFGSLLLMSGSIEPRTCAEEDEPRVTFRLFESPRGGEPVWSRELSLPSRPESMYLLQQLRARTKGKELWLDIEVNGEKLSSRTKAPVQFMSWKALEGITVRPRVEFGPIGFRSLSGCPFFESIATVDLPAEQPGTWIVDVTGTLEWSHSRANVELGLDFGDGPTSVIRASSPGGDSPSYTTFHLSGSWPARKTDTDLEMVSRTTNAPSPPTIEIASFRVQYIPSI